MSAGLIVVGDTVMDAGEHGRDGRRMQEILRKDSRIVSVQRAVHDVHGDSVEHLEEKDHGGARRTRSWILERSPETGTHGTLA